VCVRCADDAGREKEKHMRYFQIFVARAHRRDIVLAAKPKLRFYGDVEFFYGKNGAMVTAEGVTGRMESWLTAVTGDRCLCTASGGLIRSWADNTPGFATLAAVARGRACAYPPLEGAAR
jgi:hypothetical protein